MRRPGMWVLFFAAVAFVAVAVCSEVSAQWGAIQRGVDALQKGKQDGTSRPDRTVGPASAAGSTAPVTYRNAARNVQYTIPAGWERVEGDPNTESVGFKKAGASWGFNVHMNQMVPSFPRKAAVDAGLKQDKERVTIRQLLEARRRDDGDAKRKCGVIGWEIVEAPQKNSFQRIIWQCYDGENYYMNFMAYSSNGDFNAARTTLREVMDSVKFCH